MGVVGTDRVGVEGNKKKFEGSLAEVGTDC